MNTYLCRVFCRRGWTPNMLMAISRIQDGLAEINYDGDVAERPVVDLIYGNTPKARVTMAALRAIRLRLSNATLMVGAADHLAARQHILQSLAGLTRAPDLHGCMLVAVEIEISIWDSSSRFGWASK